MEQLDNEVQQTMEILNGLPGVETFSSCSGHGTNLCYISFRCSKFHSLKRIIKAVNSIRWDCGNDFDSQVHLWAIHPIPNSEGEIIWSIDWQEISEKRGEEIKMSQAWQALEGALHRGKDKPPLLSEEEAYKAYDTGWLPHINETLTDYELAVLRALAIAQAQWDICVKHYEGGKYES